MSVSVNFSLVGSVIGFTVQTTAAAALALVALILLGRRRPASARAEQAGRGWAQQHPAIEVEHLPTKLYRAPGPIRRLLAAVTTSAIAVTLGVVLAILVAFAAVYAVITVTGLLDR